MLKHHMAVQHWRLNCLGNDYRRATINATYSWKCHVKMTWMGDSVAVSMSRRNDLVALWLLIPYYSPPFIDSRVDLVFALFVTGSHIGDLLNADFHLVDVPGERYQIWQVNNWFNFRWIDNKPANGLNRKERPSLQTMNHWFPTNFTAHAEPVGTFVVRTSTGVMMV